MARVLVADDNERILELLDTDLSLEGHEVVRAADGDEAVARAEEARPDAILLDVMMPGIDGFEVARRLRAREEFANTPIIIVSAMGRDEDVWKGWQAGVDSYIVKPFEFSTIHEELRRLGIPSAGPASQVLHALMEEVGDMAEDDAGDQGDVEVA